MNEITTTEKTTKKGLPIIFWILAALALGIFVYFVFVAEKVDTTQEITIPDGTEITITGLPTDDTTVVATVDGREVTQGQVNELINSELVARSVNFADLAPEEQESLQSTSVDLMIDYVLLLQAAEKAGVSVDKAETEAQIAQIKEQLPEAEFNSQLAQLNVTEERLTETIHNSRLIDSYIQSNVLTQDITVTDAEVDTEMALIIEGNGGQEAFDEQLAASGMDEATLKESIREGVKAQKEQALVEAHIASLRASATITQ